MPSGAAHLCLGLRVPCKRVFHCCVSAKTVVATIALLACALACRGDVGCIGRDSAPSYVNTVDSSAGILLLRDAFKPGTGPDAEPVFAFVAQPTFEYVHLLMSPARAAARVQTHCSWLQEHLQRAHHSNNLHHDGCAAGVCTASLSRCVHPVSACAHPIMQSRVYASNSCCVAEFGLFTTLINGMPPYVFLHRRELRGLDVPRLPEQCMVRGLLCDIWPRRHVLHFGNGT